MEKNHVSPFMLASLIIISILIRCAPTRAKLQKDFYRHSCPQAEGTIEQIVSAYVKDDSEVAAGILRLAFHDCFVRGCDGSILLDYSPEGFSVEKNSPANVGIRSLELVDFIKLKLEQMCPSTVSCADILMLAARDAAVNVGLPAYALSSGRRDGLVSLETEATEQLPAPFNSLDILLRRFARKGFSLEEMVVLSGAHSIGRSGCKHFERRLYNFSYEGPQDPSLDPDYANFLKPLCSITDFFQPLPFMLTDDRPTAALDTITTHVLDNKYYEGLQMGRGLLASDQELMTDRRTRKLVKYFALHGDRWARKFGKAMVKLSQLDVLTGDRGEIRKHCRFVN